MSEREKRECEEYLKMEKWGVPAVICFIVVACYLLHGMWELGCSL